MSMNYERAIPCPTCGKESTHEIWLSLNVRLDPEARQKLLDNELLTFHCPYCGVERSIPTPLVYDDEERRFMVQIVHDGSTPDDVSIRTMEADGFDMTGFRFRVVDSVAELLEKIHLFESNLDDRIMEIFKAYMRHTDRKNQYPPGSIVIFAGFQQGKKEQEIVLVAGNKSQREIVRYPARKYDAVHENSMALVNIEQNQKGPHPLWRRINAGYARKILNYDE